MPYHDYIEHFHNTRRRHSALGMLTPTEYEHRHSHTINAACLQQLNSTERGADHLSAWSAVYGWGGKMGRYAEGIELSEAVGTGLAPHGPSARRRC